MSPTKEEKEKLLSEFKQIISKDGPLSKDGSRRQFTDEVLLRILIAWECNVKNSLSTLNNYVKIHEKHRNLIVSPSTHGEDILRRAGSLLPCNVRTLNNSRILYIQYTEWDPDLYSWQDMVRAMICVIETIDLNPDTHEAGYVTMINAEGISWKHVKAINPKIVMAAASMFLYELPISLRKIIIFNANVFVDMIWKIVKPLMPTDFVKLTTIISTKNVDELSGYLPQDVLEEKSYIHTKDSIDDHVKFVTGNREKLIENWNSIFDGRIF